jgi:hypothetical protein
MRFLGLFALLLFHVALFAIVAGAIWGDAVRKVSSDVRTLVPMFFLLTWVGSIIGMYQNAQFPRKGLRWGAHATAHLAALAAGFAVALFVANLATAIGELEYRTLGLDFDGNWQGGTWFVMLLISLTAATAAAGRSRAFVLRQMA